MTKPRIFIGSSLEGVKIAQAIQALLAPDADVTLWNEGFFQLGETYVETLCNSANKFDYAILVLTPDDVVGSRNNESFGPRDNVIFELGLFMGAIGRKKTILVHQNDASLKIPSDLAGVITATFDWAAGNEDYMKAVEPACNRIKSAIVEQRYIFRRDAYSQEEIARYLKSK